MATATVNNSQHPTFSTTVAETTTFLRPHKSLAVTNHDASNKLYFSVDPTHEVQTITFSSFDATDTVKFAHQGVESASAVTYEDVATARIQEVLESLPSIGVGNVAVTRTSASVYVATFRGQRAGQDIPPITVTSGTGSATGTVAETTKGGTYPATAVAAAAGTYVVLPGTTKVLNVWTGTKVSCVGSGGVYSVEVF